MGFLGALKKIASPITNIFDPAQAEAVTPNLINPFTQSQVQGSDKASLDALANQRQFLSALQAQNGVGNQSSVFQQQQALANQLGAMSQGAGPNPAAAQLAQATGENVANQAALMAGQRGSSANAGLIARLAAQQGGNLQQQAASQAATLQAQQQLAAINALQQQQQGMGALAGQQVGQLQQGLGSQIGGQQQQQNMYMNAIANQNNNAVGVAGQQNQVNAANAASQNQLSGALLGTAGGLLTTFGGGSGKSASTPTLTSAVSPGSPGTGQSQTMRAAHGGVVPGQAKVEGDNPKNDTVSAKLSPGEIVIPRSVLDSSDPAQAAMHFVAGIMASKKDSSSGAFAGGGEVNDKKWGSIVGPLVTGVQDAFNAPAPNLQKNVKNLGTGFYNPSASIPEAVRTPAAPMEEALMADPVTTAETAPLTQEAVQMPVGSGTTQSGLNQTVRGIERQAEAEGELGKQQAHILEQQALEQRQMADSYAENRAKIDQEINTLQSDYAAGKIDPQRYISNMSGGEKAITAIGLILGGLGQGYAGGENVALKLLQRSIDQDIEAQKSDMSRKENLLNMNYRKYGNLKDATDMTRLMSTQAIANQLDKKAAEAKDPLAKARALQMAGELRMKVGPELDKIARRQTIGALAKNGKMPAEMAINHIVEDNDKKAAREELQQVNLIKQGKQDIRKVFADLEKMGSFPSSTPGAATKASFEAKRARALFTLASLVKPVTMNMSDSERQAYVGGYLPDKWDKKTASDEKLKEALGLIKTIEAKGFPTLTGYNIGTSTDPDLSPLQRRQVEWAKKVLSAPATMQDKQPDAVKEARQTLIELGVE